MLREMLADMLAHVTAHRYLGICKLGQEKKGKLNGSRYPALDLGRRY